jgi:hypothetical protein
MLNPMIDQNELNQKLDRIERNMQLLLAENEKLIILRDSAFVERDACIGLAAQLAVAHGLTVGVSENTVVLDLTGGQVSWEFGESEAHLFGMLPPYAGQIEELDPVEKYRRVMNPGILPSV